MGNSFLDRNIKWIFPLPAVLFILLMMVFPILYTVWNSLTPWSISRGQPAGSDNPWEATTLEWATPTPPPHGNFAEVPEVYRDPYEYSVPGDSQDYAPQFKRA